MEFPSLGLHCQNPECKQTDFLPLECKCGKVFCRKHFSEHALSEECDQAPKPREVKLINDDMIFRCSSKGCKKGNLHEMLCPKCKRHFCIDHRFHPECPEISDDVMEAKREQINEIKRQFQEASKNLQAKITEQIRKSLQSNTKYKTAAKVHLMRIKQKAKGHKTVPAKDRIYFSISKPKSSEAKPLIVANSESIPCLDNYQIEPDLKDSIPIFVSKSWTMGRCLDVLCDICDILNENNKLNTNKVRLFRQLDGYCISPVKMDVEINELVEKEILVEGDRLLVEYVSPDQLQELNEFSQVYITS